MLSSLRKFSNSVYAKIFLGIVAIPFIFWGMGSSFTGGSKNVVVVIDKEKFTTQDFASFIQRYSTPEQKFNEKEIEDLLSLFIGDKLIDKEIEGLNIKLSDESLSDLIKNQQNFKRDNKFSRVEYEKFLLKNNISAAIFEASLANQEKKKQLLDFIGGGVMPSNFIVNVVYNKINQKRKVQVLDLEKMLKKETNFTDVEIKTFYEDNKENFKEIFKSVNILELTPKKLIEEENFNEMFYKKIDEIDNLIIQGENLSHILNKFNLKKPNLYIFDKFGKDLNYKKIESLPDQLVTKIYSLNNIERTALFEINDKYFIIEVVKTENILRDINDNNLRSFIINNLKRRNIEKEVSEIINKINDKTFLKVDFDKLSEDINTQIKFVKLENINDNKNLNKEIVKQVYNFSEKKIILASSKDFTKSFLIYIDKIENVNINDNAELYEEYFNLSKFQLTGKLLNTYDNYIKEKYKIDINYNALNTVKNYFN
tara:strand:+ start:16 stop:1464 length:1449 start_codon:yes stop_codon:yes gene_type:complete